MIDMSTSPEQLPEGNPSAISRSHIQRVHTTDLYSAQEVDPEDALSTTTDGMGRMSFIFDEDGSLDTEITSVNQK